MTIRNPEHRSTSRGPVARGAMMLVAVLSAGAANAQDVPVMRTGLWEVSRTVNAATDGGAPQTIRVADCVNPNKDMVARQEMLKKIGCTLSPVDHSGNTYTFSAICGQGGSETSRSILTVESDNAYSIRIESNIGGTPSQELLRATRLGDCPT